MKTIAMKTRNMVNTNKEGTTMDFKKRIMVQNEVQIRSFTFWNELFKLLDKIKYRPEDFDLGGANYITAELTGGYSLMMDRVGDAWIIKEGDNRRHSFQKWDQKDDFPYTKILDWYLKDSVLKKLE